ncbi:MAG: glycosyltransferase family 4 protein [Rickettsiaceae bacterium]|nr:glycosyltransferase family 4 protein [Rickettsiaceae bacterium]
MIESLNWHLNNFYTSQKFWLLPTSLILSFILSACFILISIPILTHFKIVDMPNSRRAHLKPTIRGGGIGFVIAFLMSLCYVSSLTNEHLNILPLIIASSLAALISFIDDVKGISIVPRLFIHFVAASICLVCYLSPHLIFRGEVAPDLDLALCILALVLFTNIYNFLDGIDGISAAQSIHLSVTTLLLCIIRDKVIINVDLVFYSSAIIFGASSAFMIFNWSPASVFMGDVGSIFLGLIHGSNLLLIAASSERLFLASVIASLYYIADGGITILIRLMKREKIWLPHLNHFFQQAVRKGMSHREIVSKIACCNFILLCLSIYSIYSPHVAIIFSIICITFIIVHFHHHK